MNTQKEEREGRKKKRGGRKKRKEKGEMRK